MLDPTDWMAGQPTTFSTRAFVRTRRGASTWVNWNHRLGGGPELKVHPGLVEVMAPQGGMLASRHLRLQAERTTMRRDRVGWGGTPLGRKDCIRMLHGRGLSAIEVAITPEGGIDETWRALLAAGVRAWEPSAKERDSK